MSMAPMATSEAKVVASLSLELVAVVGDFGSAERGWWQVGQQAMRGPQILYLPRRDGEGKDAARAIHDEVDLGASSAVRLERSKA